MLLLVLILLPRMLIPALLFAARPVVTGTSTGEDVPSPTVKWTPTRWSMSPSGSNG